jgi:hypothetical protein
MDNRQTLEVKAFNAPVLPPHYQEHLRRIPVKDPTISPEHFVKGVEQGTYCLIAVFHQHRHVMSLACVIEIGDQGNALNVCGIGKAQETEVTLADINRQIDAIARENGCNSVTGRAQSPALCKVYEQLGYETQEYVMRKTV